MFRAIILGAFYFGSIGVIGLIGIPWTFLTGSIDWMYRRAMTAASFGIRLAGIQVDVVGLDRFDMGGTYIFMCNHVSNLDAPIVVPAIPRRTSVLVKRELFRIPILAKAMLMARFVPVDRQNRDAAIASIQQATEVMRSGINITVFPEGTRSPDGRLLPFKKGPFHLAMESQFPVIPMTIYGTEALMPKKGFAVRKGRVTLVFHAPICPKDFETREQLSAAVFRQIESALPLNLRA